jgi:DNA integrity scanning protein DisA with diadenylate cyclase activity
MSKRPINERIAELITDMVGSMWCAYLFAALALVSLPQAIQAGTMAIVSWLSQTFLQLVLLSVIMVGQDVASRRAERRAERTYRDAEEILKLLRRHGEMIEESTIVLTRAPKREKKCPDPLDGPKGEPHPW